MTRQDYDASQITVLEWLEPVRQRPGMYIGSTDLRWLHHLVTEIVDNAIDEALAWYCTMITVMVQADGYVTVMDNGRGIPVDTVAKTWKSWLETVFTILHAWGKFQKSAYKISWWLHGVWASVVNALSEQLIAVVHKNWKKYQQEYSRGIPVWWLQEVWDSDVNGTTVTRKADKLIFETTEYNFHNLVTKYRQSAYLTPGVTFTVMNEVTWERHRFYFESGIKTWLGSMTQSHTQLTPAIAVVHESEELGADIAFQFVDSQNSNILSFVNNIHTADWWTHLNGFKWWLLTVVNEYAKQWWFLDPKIWEFQPWDITDGLYAIVSVKVPNPEFEWQTKWRLWSSYVKKEIEELVYNLIHWYFKEFPDVARKVIEKIWLSAKARMAAKLARESVLRKSPLGTSVLPGKLTDCSSKDRSSTELFIVEGESAWGSAKQWRNSAYQAILPLKWKILNTEQALIQRVLWNEEVKALILAIWAWLKESFDVEKIRYDKIVIMTDADVDGAHIRTLLLTFFFRYMRPLIDTWHLYIAVSPLYKISQWKKEHYVYPPLDVPLDEIAKNYGYDWKYDIQRYKGLWEMNPEQLRDTTMDPSTRMIKQVMVDDAEESDRLFTVLMGEDVMSRKHFILAHAKNVQDLDV